MPHQATSRAGYEIATLGARQRQVYDAFISAGEAGMTNLEISDALKLPINVVCGATNALVKAGAVVDSGRKRKSVFRVLNIIWRVATPADRQQIAIEAGQLSLFQ